MHEYMLDIVKNETAATAMTIGSLFVVSIIWFVTSSWISTKLAPKPIDKVGHKIQEYNSRINTINEDLDYIRTCRDDILNEIANSQSSTDVQNMDAIDKMSRVYSDDYRLNEYDSIINKYLLEVKILEQRRNMLIHDTAKQIKAGLVQ